MSDIDTLLAHWQKHMTLSEAAEGVLKDWDKLSYDGDLIPLHYLDEARELLKIMAHRERQYKELLNRKHPVYEFATLIISRWEYKDGNSDIIEYTTFTVWKHGDSVGDIDPSYNDIKAHEFALAKASSEGWRICSEVMHISEKREYLTHVYTLQREKL